jgi:translation initiation factor IF-2
MTPSKRPLPGRPLPSTSLPKGLLKKVAAAKPAPAKPATPRPMPKPVVAAPSPTLSKEATAAAALTTLRSGGPAIPKSMAAPRPSFARAKSWKGNKAGRRAAIAVAILFLCVLAWAIFFRRGDRVAAIESLQSKMDDRNLSWDDRRALGRQVREQERKLTPDERDKAQALREDRRGGGGFEQRLVSFFAKSPEDQIKELDKRIDDMMKNGNGGGGGRGGFGGGGPGGGGRGGRGGDPNSNAGRNRRLSSTPADTKAQRTIGRQLGQAYQSMLTNRASQRGITLPGGGGSRG